MTFYDQDAEPEAPPEPDPPGLIASPWDVFALVGELVDDLSSVSPGDQDFLVGRAWAEALIAAVYGGETSSDTESLAAVLGVPPEVVPGPHQHGLNLRYQYEQWPSRPCPKDPDGLHFPGCGCEF